MQIGRRQEFSMCGVERPRMDGQFCSAPSPTGHGLANVDALKDSPTDVATRRWTRRNLHLLSCANAPQERSELLRSVLDVPLIVFTAHGRASSGNRHPATNFCPVFSSDCSAG
jgi:hypothetical protein